MISVIILTYNEEGFIGQIIDEIEQQDYNDYEILLADGGSSDRTIDIATYRKIQIIHCPKGKAFQMNTAAKEANGEILFFVHADMFLKTNTLRVLQEKISQGYHGGGFANAFNEHNEKIKRIGTIMNFRFFDKREQSDKGIFYGDNGIFVLRKIFEELGGFKEIPIMEDYEFSQRLNQQHKLIKIYDPKIIVSARRHVKAGFWKTRLQWIMIRVLFKMKVPAKYLRNLYGDVR